LRTPEEKQEHKKIRQHAAWEKWYRSPKGEAYKQKVKNKRLLKGEKPS
jgi:hypothetical protein